MPTVADTFHAAFGDPDPSTADGLPPELALGAWGRWGKTTGAGWFDDRFLFLFGPGLEALEACLEAWSFLVPPPDGNRVILGYNAYGAILVHESKGAVDLVKVLNPLDVTYFANANLNLHSLVGSWLPERRLPRFFDKKVYAEWQRQHDGAALDDREILGIGVPLSLEGTLTLDNFAPQDIVEYYQQAAPAYARAFASMKP